MLISFYIFSLCVCFSPLLVCSFWSLARLQVCFHAIDSTQFPMLGKNEQKTADVCLQCHIKSIYDNLIVPIEWFSLVRVRAISLSVHLVHMEIDHFGMNTLTAHKFGISPFSILDLQLFKSRKSEAHTARIAEKETKRTKTWSRIPNSQHVTSSHTHHDDDPKAACRCRCTYVVGR